MNNLRLKFGLICFFLAAIFVVSFFFFKSSTTLPNVIVILVDTLRADHLQTYGYSRATSKGLDQLAQDSLVFERAIAAAPWTVPAVSTLMTGLYPRQHGNQPVRDRSKAMKLGTELSPDLITLSERLKAKSYRTAAVSANPWISKEFGFDQGFDDFYYFDHALADKVVKSSKKIVEDFSENKSKPFLLYMHFMDPHSPYTPPENYKNKFSGSAGNIPYQPKEQNKINLYDAEILFVDDQISDFLSFLKQKELYDDTIIVFLADHGEAFKEHGTGGHGYQLFMEEVHVPLIVKIPGYKGRVKETVSQIDILPTLLELLKEPKDQQLPGISLLDDDKIKNRAGVYSEVYRVYQQQSFSTVAGERLIQELGPPKSPVMPNSFGLFDLNSDPYEQQSLDDKEIYTELRGYLDSVVKNSNPVIDSKEISISDETMKKLETLGYIN